MTDRTVDVCAYLEARETEFLNVSGRCFATGVLTIIAAHWPDLTVAELDAAFRTVHDTRRARRQIEKGAPLQ